MSMSGARVEEAAKSLQESGGNVDGAAVDLLQAKSTTPDKSFESHDMESLPEYVESTPQKATRCQEKFVDNEDERVAASISNPQYSPTSREREGETHQGRR